ncbi:hypothetical protein EV175_005997 [Coemansia sp. RSA 1933]|nr:hypothetical protein EV175_005997 [Coemansia sp. RSA 1933]
MHHIPDRSSGPVDYGPTWRTAEPGEVLPVNQAPRESQLTNVAGSDYINSDDALSALFMAAATTPDYSTLRQSAYTDDTYSTFDTLISEPSVSTAPATTHFNNNNTSNNNSAYTVTPSSMDLNYYTIGEGRGKGVAEAALLESFTMADYYALAPQLRMDGGSASSSALPRTSTLGSLSDLVTPGSAFLRPSDVFSTPMLSDTTTTTAAGASAIAAAFAGTSSASVPATPAHTLGLFTSGPATAPLQQQTTATPSVDALLSAYDSYMGTPAAPGFASPGVRVAPGSSTLFAPLDEVQADRLGDVRSLLSHVAAHADPAFRQNLVHALVDMIKPSVAYQAVNDRPAPPPQASLLLAQAQNLASAATALDDVTDYSAEAPLLDSLLGLLSPPVAADHAPPTAASPRLFSPGMAAVAAPECMFRSPVLQTISEDDGCGEEDDVPLVKCLSPVVAGTKRKRDAASDDDKQQRFHCDICNRGFSRQYNMRTHRLTHNPDGAAARPHSCLHCPRTFTRKHDLVRHQVLHDSSGAFKCSTCSRAFARLDVLERHVRALHKD